MAHPLRRSNVAAEVVGDLWRKFERTKRKRSGFWTTCAPPCASLLAYSPEIAREGKKERVRRLRRADPLSEIERGWRALKNSLMLRAVCHWTEDRIKEESHHIHDLQDDNGGENEADLAMSHLETKSDISYILQ